MSSSTPHRQSCSPRDRHKYHGHFPNAGNFDYFWNMYPCTFYDAFDHCVVICEKFMVMLKRMDNIIGMKHDEYPSHERVSFSVSKRKSFCTHCQMNEHVNQQC